MVKFFKPAAFGVASITCLIAAAPAVSGTLTPVEIAGLDLGTAGDYTVVGLADGETLKINSGPIDGGTTAGVLVGSNMEIDTSGGNDGGVTNGIHGDGTQGPDYGDLENPTDFTLVSTEVTAAAKASANDVATFAASLVADYVYDKVEDITFTSAGTLTVISLNELKNEVTFDGSADDIFVVNINDKFSSNQSMYLTGGVQASNILFNFLGNSGNCFSTSGGNSLVGTYLSAGGCDFQFSSLNLEGALINTAGSIQFVSGSEASFAGFSTGETTVVPLPAGVFFLGSALGILVSRKAYKRLSQKS